MLSCHHELEEIDICLTEHSFWDQFQCSRLHERFCSIGNRRSARNVVGSKGMVLVDRARDQRSGSIVVNKITFKDAVQMSAVDDQKLVFEEQSFRNHRFGPARTKQRGQGGHQMHEQRQ